MSNFIIQNISYGLNLYQDIQEESQFLQLAQSYRTLSIIHHKLISKKPLTNEEKIAGVISAMPCLQTFKGFANALLEQKLRVKIKDYFFSEVSIFIFRYASKKFQLKENIRDFVVSTVSEVNKPGSRTDETTLKIRKVFAQARAYCAPTLEAIGLKESPELILLLEPLSAILVTKLAKKITKTALLAISNF
jgi:hypothetical protein